MLTCRNACTLDLLESLVEYRTTIQKDLHCQGRSSITKHVMMSSILFIINIIDFDEKLWLPAPNRHTEMNYRMYYTLVQRKAAGYKLFF